MPRSRDDDREAELAQLAEGSSEIQTWEARGSGETDILAGADPEVDRQGGRGTKLVAGCSQECEVQWAQQSRRHREPKWQDNAPYRDDRTGPCMESATGYDGAAMEEAYGVAKPGTAAALGIAAFACSIEESSPGAATSKKVATDGSEDP